jgi:hypothetical protein
MTYSEKLKDPRWQRKRLEIMERDRWACQHCAATDKSMTVHHVVYHQRRDPWEYENDELLALCEGCHNEIERQIKCIRFFMAHNPELMGQVWDFVNALAEKERGAK